MAAALVLGSTGCRSKLDKADAYEAQFDRLMTVKAYPAALFSIRRAIDNDDTNPRRYLKMAELQMMTGQPAAASASFQAALDLQPDNLEALQNLSILAARGGQYDDAQRYIDPLLALSPNDPAGLLASGAIAVGQRHFADASMFADRIIAALPDRSDGYVLKARALDSLGHTREAIALLRQRAAVASDPKDLLSQLMVFYRREGDLSGIRATAIRMMSLFPDDPRYAIEAARAYQASGDATKVRAITDDLVRRFKGNPDVLVAVAEFWRDVAPPDRAKAEIARIADGAPQHARIALADEMIAIGDDQAALHMLAPFAEPKVTSGNVDAQAHYARALFAAGQFGTAQAKADAILAFDRDNAAALLIRARLKLRAGDYRGAVTDAQTVSSDDDRNAEAALLVPTVYAAQGNNVLAAGAFGSARQSFPDDPAISSAEIQWLLHQQRNEEAAQRAATFYHAHPRSGPAAQAYIALCRQVRTDTCRLDSSSPPAPHPARS